MLELIVDVHHLAEMGSDILRKAIAQIRDEDAERKQKSTPPR